MQELLTNVQWFLLNPEMQEILPIFYIAIGIPLFIFLFYFDWTKKAFTKLYRRFIVFAIIFFLISLILSFEIMLLIMKNIFLYTGIVFLIIIGAVSLNFFYIKLMEWVDVRENEVDK